MFNLEENSVSKPMVSDGSKRPRSFCNDDGKDPGEKQTASPVRKGAQGNSRKAKQGSEKTRKGANMEGNGLKRLTMHKMRS